MTFTGSLDAVNITVTPPLTLQDVADAYEKSLEITVIEQLGPGETLIGIIVTSIGGVPTINSTRRNLRKHLAERSLADVISKVEFEIRVEKLCSTGNCQDSEVVTKEIFEEVTTAIDNAIKKGDATVAGSFQSVFLSVTTEKGQNLLISYASLKDVGTYGR